MASKNGLDEEYEGLDDEMEEELYSELDDDRREEIEQMLGLKVLGVELYEDSLGDEEEEQPVKPEERVFFDCDLFFDENHALELYVTSVYPDPDKDPIMGMDAIFDVVGRLADDQLELVDYGEADEEGGLVLAFGHGEKVELVLVSSAWMVSEWEPEDEEDEDEDEDDDFEDDDED